MSILFERIKRTAAEHIAELGYQTRSFYRATKNSRLTKFVVLGTIRSGSTLMTSTLNTHPAATCFYEPFHIQRDSIPFNVVGFKRLQKNPRALHLRSSDPVGFVNQYMYRNWHPKKIRAVGFKLLYTQARLDSWWRTGEFEGWWQHCGFPPIYGSEASSLWQYLHDMTSIKVIHIKRLNKVEAVLSGQTAIESKSWGDGASGGFKDSNNYRQYIDPRTVSLTIKENALFEEEITQSFSADRLLTVTYEDLCTKQAETFNGVFDFLGIPRCAIAPSTRKLRTVGLEQSIENYQELKTAFPQFF
jgi:LPS sulfotransferase NodH